MDQALQSQISKFDKDQYAALFWQVYGWMSKHNIDELDKAVDSAMRNSTQEKRSM